MGTPDERRSARTNVLLKAAVEWQGERITVRVANLSAHGALLIGDGFPERDTIITFRCQKVTIPGWVMWADAGRAGIQFEQSIEPESLAYKKLESRIVITPDIRDLDFRRPGFRGNQMTDDERKIVEEWTRSEIKPGSGGRHH